MMATKMRLSAVRGHSLCRYKATAVFSTSVARYSANNTLVNELPTPKNGRILTDTKDLAMSPWIYHGPEEFYLERFLSKSGKLEVPKYLISFCRETRLGKNCSNSTFIATVCN